MTSRSEIAVEKLFDGFNCAQSIFFSFSDVVGIEKELTLKLACGFGAGMGRKEEVCGAVSGGILVISAKYGKVRKDDKPATELTYKKTRDLMEQFAAQNGSYICRELIEGCDLTTDTGQAYFKERDLLKKKCAVCVRTVVEILEEIL